MGIISWLILGLIAGLLGGKLVNGRGDGLIFDIVLGIVGAFVGGFIFHLLGVTGLNLWGMLVAVIGAVVVLIAYHAIVGRWAA